MSRYIEQCTGSKYRHNVQTRCTYVCGEALGPHDAVQHCPLVEVEETGVSCPGEEVACQLQYIISCTCLLRLGPMSLQNTHMGSQKISENQPGPVSVARVSTPVKCQLEYIVDRTCLLRLGLMSLQKTYVGLPKASRQ